jgi:LPS-assembly protein
MMRLFFRVAICALAGAAVADVQDPSVGGQVAPAERLPIDIQADRLEYRDNNQTLVAIGSVVVTHGESVLRSDHMTINTETYDVVGSGNVDINHDGRVYTGDNFNYNIRTRKGDFLDVAIYQGPWTVTADSTERIDTNTFLFRNSTITSCDENDREFYIKAKETVVVQGEEMRSKNVVFYLGGVPILWLPYAKRDLTADKTQIDVIPGYSDRMGAFILTAYNYRFNETFQGATHLDYRDKRGVGVGQDVFWDDPKTGSYDGEFNVYYTDDDMPFEDDLDREKTQNLVDSDRYRFKVRHQQAITPDDTLRIRGNYLSDPDIIEDFFDREFRYNTQPENYATLTHREREYIASVNVNKRLNDFYTNVNRVPEFTFDVPRLRLQDTSFYVDSRNSAGYLEAEIADQLMQQDFDSGRVDSDNTLFLYTRHFGWLNVIPRVGYAGTYYSNSPDPRTVTSVSTTTNELGEIVTTETSATGFVDGSSETRSAFQLGLETSYKAFQVLHSDQRGFDMGLRHVVEPFANYTFVPDPSTKPEDSYQFDFIDRRDELNDLLLGVRNKLQTKRRGRIHDLADVNVFTIVNVDKSPQEVETIEIVGFDGEFRVVDSLRLDVDGLFDTVRDEINTFNAQALYRHSDLSSLGLEYRFREKSRDLIAGELSLFPDQKLSYTGYVRYDFDFTELEEHSHFIQKKTDCLGFGVGIREIDDDITVWAQIWLLAFPRSIAGLGR